MLATPPCEGEKYVPGSVVSDLQSRGECDAAHTHAHIPTKQTAEYVLVQTAASGDGACATCVKLQGEVNKSQQIVGELVRQIQESTPSKATAEEARYENKYRRAKDELMIARKECSKQQKKLAEQQSEITQQQLELQHLQVTYISNIISRSLSLSLTPSLSRSPPPVRGCVGEYLCICGLQAGSAATVELLYPFGCVGIW